MEGKRIVVATGLRTPTGQIGKSLFNYSSVDLSTLILKELLKTSRLDPVCVDGLILGEVSQGSQAPNTARVVAVKGGLSFGCVAHTVQNNCISGIQAIVDAARKILLGEGETFVAMGSESMSNMVMYVRSGRQKFGNPERIKSLISEAEIVDTIVEGLTDPICGMNMAETAEVIAQNLGISKEDQDSYALESFRKTYLSEESGFYDPYLVKLSELQRDEYPYLRKAFADGSDKARSRMQRAPLVIEAMGMSIQDFYQKYGQYISREYGTGCTGTVSLFNACSQSDGAAAVIVASEKRALELGLDIKMYLSGWGFTALHPAYMGISPAHAVPLALHHSGRSFNEVDFFEVHEAFAATVLGLFKEGWNKYEMNWDAKYKEGRINRNGGSLSLGHPLGATGVRLALNAMGEFERDKNAKVAVVTACAGGGIGGALIFERV